jgi:hypothetical protein
MGFSWDFHGIFMGFSWDFHGIFMGFSWDFHGIFMGFSNHIIRETLKLSVIVHSGCTVL